MRFLLALCVVALSATAAAAADSEPISVKGDQVEYFDTMGKVIATGNVEAVYRDAKLTCDRATIYMQTKDAYLEGRVRLTQLGALLKGEQIVYNFETRKGTILDAEGEFGPWRSRGDQAEKISEDSVIHRKGYLTTCDFEQPHTRFQAREVRVFMDDKIVLKDVVMRIGNVPVLYLPSYTHLLDDKRPRVTIIPGKDKQWGLFLLTSWRVYLHENLQGHFHLDFRERLDLASGFDMKYKLPVGGEGLFRTYYTHERAIQREHFWSKLTNPDEDKPTIERERSRFQLRHIWDVDEDTRATLEYNRQQDPTVVKDFFEREFEDNTATAPTYFQVIKTSPWYGLTFLVNKRSNRFETLTQQLPSITFNLRPIELPFLPSFEPWINRLEHRQGPEPGQQAYSGWFYQSSYQYEHSNLADRVDGTEDSLLKFDSNHELSHPMRLLRRFNFRPFTKFRQTSFSRGSTENGSLFRQQGGAGFEFSTKFFRVLDWHTNLWNLNINRVRHLVTPNIKYEFLGKPTLSADRFLRTDGLAKGNLVTPSLEQKLQTKRSNEPGGKTVDLVRLITTMPYDVEGASGVGGEWQTATMDLEALPYDWMRVESDASVDPHIGQFTTINADLVLVPGGTASWGGKRIGDIVNAETGEDQELPWAAGLGWRYQRRTSAQLTFETEFNIGRKWRAGIYQALDVKRFAEENTTLGPRTVKKINDSPEYEYRLRRDLHEWTVELVYNVRRGQGESLLLLFRLKAAPDLPFDFQRSYHRPKAGRNFPKK